MITFMKAKNLSFFSHNVCVTQVLNSEYMFPIKSSMKEVKPFNRSTLQSLNVDNETELFIFFLNHGIPNEFSNSFLIYQYFLERIIELNSKKNYIFIDCCFSGSFIGAVNASVELIKIFPQVTGENSECYNIRLQALAKILIDFKHFQDLQYNEIIENFSIQQEEIKTQLHQNLQLIFSTDFQNKFAEFISLMGTLTNTNIVPQYFAQKKFNNFLFFRRMYQIVLFALSPFPFIVLSKNLFIWNIFFFNYT